MESAAPVAGLGLERVFELLEELESLPLSGGTGQTIEVLRRALRTTRLPVLSEAVIQAVKVVESPQCDVLDLADTLNASDELAQRVIEIANASFFAGGEPVYTARDAIVRMGIRETRNAVIALSVRGIIVEQHGFVELRRRLWEHSLGTAAAAQGILCEVAYEDSIGFMTGLSHDLGRALVLNFVARWNGESALPRSGVEAVGDKIHAELGAVLLESWRFPQQIVEAIRYHHHVDDADSAAQGTARALGAADVMAHQLDKATLATSVPESLVSHLQRLGIAPDRGIRLARESRARFEELLKIF